MSLTSVASSRRDRAEQCQRSYAKLPLQIILMARQDTQDFRSIHGLSDALRFLDSFPPLAQRSLPSPLLEVGPLLLVGHALYLFVDFRLGTAFEIHAIKGFLSYRRRCS